MQSMSRSKTALFWATLTAVATQCLLWTPSSLANSPYTVIGERNIFGLKDPPDPTPVAPEPEPEPPPNIKITGITTVMGIPRALLKVQTPAKNGKKEEEKSLILVAGGLAKEGIEVLEIDEANGVAKDIKVKIRQGGKESWLALERDTAKAGPPPPAPGAAPAQVAAVAQKLAAARAAAGGAAPPPNVAAGIPNRPLRTGQPGAPGYQPGAAGYAPGVGGVVTDAAAINSNPKYISRDYGLSREEQVILIEANRELTRDAVAAGEMPPLPPTELTPPELNPTTPPEPDPLQGIEQLYR
jgi:hypothetical protein